MSDDVFMLFTNTGQLQRLAQKPLITMAHQQKPSLIFKPTNPNTHCTN